jgi:hypothetical protein
MIDSAVKDKLVEIKKSSQIEFEIIEEEDIIYDNKLVSTPACFKAAITTMIKEKEKTTLPNNFPESILSDL